ncbi:hypothetical protein BDW62DRAFT_200005 [Aspergillus aurantiobrunneus]
MFTAASASHIRVTVKDDTLGLGARSKRDPLDEPTGLDAFKGLLGRLNGKSDTELQADQKKRDDVKLARYAATKWQAVRFISGGLLVQEKDDESSNEACNLPAAALEVAHRTSKQGMKEAKSTGSHPSNGDASNKCRAIDQSEISSSRELRGQNDKNKINRKEKRDKREKKRKRAEQQEIPDNSSLREKSFAHDAQTTSQQDRSSSDTGPLTKERRPLGRQMIRGRHIAQKRKALMDEKSLNEIFMIKS